MDDSQDCGRGATSSEFTDVERASLHGRIARRRKMCAVTTSRTREEKSTIRARAFASASRVMRRGFERGSEKSWQAAAPIFEKTALTAMLSAAGWHSFTLRRGTARGGRRLRRRVFERHRETGLAAAHKARGRVWRWQTQRRPVAAAGRSLATPGPRRRRSRRRRTSSWFVVRRWS